MRIDWSTLALQTVNVVVLVWLLSRFLFRPVSDIIAKRQAAARKLIDDASRERDAAHAERERARAERASLAAARDDALKDALAQAAAERERLIAAARADAQALRDAARAQADADAVQRAKALDASVGRPLEPDVRVDPALIAGLELESKYANVRNSLRQDLATIEAALLNEDDADA
ncbi:ATP synthase F0 subunit B [Burkholderia pseudomallei]|nr:ATP synthase F0 subunit B [Burkholderia pseudomallei]